MDAKRNHVEPSGLGVAEPAEDDPDVATLDNMAVQHLRPSLAVLAVLYLLIGLSFHGFPPATDDVLGTTALITAGALLTFLWLLGRHKTWWRHVDALTGGVALIVLLNTLLNLALTRDPLQTLNLVLLLVGAAFIFVSTPWLVALMAATLAGWLAVAVSPFGEPLWMRFGLALVSASALSVMIHVVRSRRYRQVQLLRHAAESRAQTAQARARQLETLIDLSHTINSSLDLDQLLPDIVQTLQRRLGFDYIGIYLWDEASASLVLRAGTGDVARELAAAGVHWEIEAAGLVGWAAQRRRPVCAGDVEADGRFGGPEVLPGTRSQMVIPLETGDRLIGALDLRAEVQDAFDETDLRLCRSLADQLATAIQNASRYAGERSRRLLTEHLYSVGRALSQTLDDLQVLDLILDRLKEIVPYDRGSVLLARGDVLEIVAARGFAGVLDPLKIKVSITEDDVYQRIYRTKAPLALPKIRESDKWTYVEGLPRAQSWVGLPLINAQDRVIGMLSLAREVPDPYTEDDVALGAAFAGQAAVALQNAQLYTDLDEAYRQLEQLDRAKSDFISLASHELRTPLTVMSGYTQMLAKEPVAQEDPAAQMMIEGLEIGVAQLQEIVDRMVDLAEIESQSMQLHFLPISLHDLLLEVSWAFDQALQMRSLTLRLDDLSNLPLVEADHVALYKAFHHLVTNALKYTPDGGHIRISGRETAISNADGSWNGVDIRVVDTGIGIEPRHQRRIFDKFFQIGEVTLHSSSNVRFMGGGPGLGLAIVKGIVDAHGGDVWVESPGYDADVCPGSTFHVVLPLQPPASASGTAET